MKSPKKSSKNVGAVIKSPWPYMAFFLQGPHTRAIKKGSEILNVQFSLKLGLSETSKKPDRTIKSGKIGCKIASLRVSY